MKTFQTKNNGINIKHSKKNEKDIKVVGYGQNEDSRCPKCLSNNFEYTGKQFHGDRVYQCKKCKSLTASPTTYAGCKKFGVIGNDLIVNDCLVCPIPKQEGFDIKALAKEGKACPYFYLIKQEDIRSEDLR